MSDRRKALGRGLGALIPTGSHGTSRPVDVFFPSSQGAGTETVSRETSPDGEQEPPPVAPPKSDLVAVPGADFGYVRTDDIQPNRAQPRTVFDEDELNELAKSIREVGVLQPVVVRPTPDPQDGEAPFELVMGERRWRASQEAGVESIPAIIRSTSDDDLLRDALLENLHRT